MTIELEELAFSLTTYIHKTEHEGPWRECEESLCARTRRLMKRGDFVLGEVMKKWVRVGMNCRTEALRGTVAYVSAWMRGPGGPGGDPLLLANPLMELQGVIGLPLIRLEDIDEVLGEERPEDEAALRGPTVRQPDALTIAEIYEANVRRCPEVFHPLEDWPLERWALAFVGEAGEVANAVKKVLRGDGSLYDVATEIADTIHYGTLLMARLAQRSHSRGDIVLENAIINKFNKISREKGSQVFLGER